MANPHRGQVDIEIGGRTRTLRYDMNALAELESGLGKPIGAIFAEDNVGINVLRQALYVGLRHSDRRLTPGKVGGMMDPKRLEHYAEKLAEALNLAMGVEEESDTDPLVPKEEPEDNSTGPG